jgi:hypothetical protein
MIKILAVGDLHVKESTLATIAILNKKLLERIEEHNPNIVIFMGDLSDTHEKIHTLALNAIHDLLFSVSQHCQVYALIGNHDLVGPTLFLTKEHPFGTFGIDGKLHIVDVPMKFFGMLFVPYVPPGRFSEVLTNFDLNEIKLIWAHQEFCGARSGSFVSDRGDPWTLPIPIISGHIHEKQALGRVTYIGTPYQTNYGESPNKTVALIDYDPDTGLQNIEEISLGMPIKVTESLDVAAAHIFTVPQGSDMRLKISGTCDEIAAFKKTAKACALEAQAKVVYILTDTKVPYAVKRAQKTFLDLLHEYGQPETEQVRQLLDEALK